MSKSRQGFRWVIFVLLTSFLTTIFFSSFFVLLRRDSGGDRSSIDYLHGKAAFEVMSYLRRYRKNIELIIPEKLNVKISDDQYMYVLDQDLQFLSRSQCVDCNVKINFQVRKGIVPGLYTVQVTTRIGNTLEEKSSLFTLKGI